MCAQKNRYIHIGKQRQLACNPWGKSYSTRQTRDPGVFIMHAVMIAPDGVFTVLYVILIPFTINIVQPYRAFTSAKLCTSDSLCYTSAETGKTDNLTYFKNSSCKASSAQDYH